MAQWRWRHQYIHRALSSPLRWLGAKRHWGSSSSIRPTDGDVNHSVYCWHTHQSTSITTPTTPVTMDTYLVCKPDWWRLQPKPQPLSRRRCGDQTKRQMTGLWTRRSGDFQARAGGLASPKRPVAWSMQPTIERNGAAIVLAPNRVSNCTADTCRRFPRALWWQWHNADVMMLRRFRSDKRPNWRWLTQCVSLPCNPLRHAQIYSHQWISQQVRPIVQCKWHNSSVGYTGLFCLKPPILTERHFTSLSCKHITLMKIVKIGFQCDSRITSSMIHVFVPIFVKTRFYYSTLGH